MSGEELGAWDAGSRAIDWWGHGTQRGHANAHQVHGQGAHEGHHVLVEVREPRLSPVLRHAAIVAAEIPVCECVCVVGRVDVTRALTICARKAACGVV